MPVYYQTPKGGPKHRKGLVNWPPLEYCSGSPAGRHRLGSGIVPGAGKEKPRVSAVSYQNDILDLVEAVSHGLPHDTAAHDIGRFYQAITEEFVDF